MTAQEKAQELVERFEGNVKYALIAVDEIIKTDMLIDEDTFVETPSYLQYWKIVKQEIEKL